MTATLTRIGACAALLVFLSLPGRHPCAMAEPPNADFCAVPEELLVDNDQLPRTAARLREGGPVTIVAIGGGSTAGASPREQAYPARLQAELSRRYPNVAFSVINKGIARQSAADMVGRFASDVLPLHPVLAIWETGTNDAVHSTDLDTFGQALRDGIDLLSQHDIDIMLVDMQYSRQSSLVVNFDPYIEVMRNIADIYHVRMFRRYDIMKYWDENGIIDFEAPGEQRILVAEQTYACIARRVADVIDLATQ